MNTDSHVEVREEVTVFNLMACALLGIWCPAHSIRNVDLESMPLSWSNTVAKVLL